MAKQRMRITHLLLDIEGTTCSVSFVAEVLFPYASQQLESFLRRHGGSEAIAGLLEACDEAWSADSNPEAQALRRESLVQITQNDPGRGGDGQTRRLLPYLQWLIAHDVKCTPLKELQGYIWREGYANGDLVAPLFTDVGAALQRWQERGLVLAVYSSGSVAAQQLLYGHCQHGDLRARFSHWFDTRVGPKQCSDSYRDIATAMGALPSNVLFISDSLQELIAADQAGMQVLFSDREGNPGRDSGPFERISDYSQLDPNDAPQRP